MKRRQQRQIILTCIYQYLLTNREIDAILDENIVSISKKDIPFIIENIIGVYNNVDDYIEKISPKLKDYEFQRLGYMEQSILLLGYHELQMHQTDRAVIINEALELTKIYCDEEAPAFINGVLDQL